MQNLTAAARDLGTVPSGQIMFDGPQWFEPRCRGKKCYRVDEKHNPNKVISRTEKPTAQAYFQLRTGNALIGPYLKRIERTNDVTCRWCRRGVVQTHEHLSTRCTRCYQTQKTLWQPVKSVSDRSMTNTSIEDVSGSVPGPNRNWTDISSARAGSR
jgi:hypothetical protein